MGVNPEVKPITDAIIDAIRAEWDKVEAASEYDEKPPVPFTRKAEHVAKLAELATDAVAFLAALKTEFELLDGIALDFDDDDDELIDGFLVSPRQVSDVAVALDAVKDVLADHRYDFAPLVNPNDC